MTIYHNHHFVPKHAGGSDDPSNIRRVPVVEHASLHYERWVVTGDEFDRISWKALSGQIEMSEAKRLAMIEGAKKGGASNAINKTGLCGRSKEKMSIDGKKANACGPQLFKNSSFQKEMNIRSNAIKSLKHAAGDYRELYKAIGEKLSGAYTKERGFVNSGWVDSSRGKIQASLNNSLSTCPHCNKKGQYRAMKRWHFDKCSVLPKD